MNNLIIRPIRPEETILLLDFLYEAIYQSDTSQPIPRTILQQPPLWKYIDNFGSRKGDLCAVAIIDNLIIGAVWVRFVRSYGFVSEELPELSISLYPEYRGQGIGTQLMLYIQKMLKETGCCGVSLSVSKQNRTFRWYQTLGFSIAQENESDYVMVKYLNPAG
ncbi:GNAT family N-acetyltransferase [Bacteroides sp. An51A]|uniref:GNAT family N-acetyltransferase n=1 Tax=Bacteroides sp. An51A TaxID=1965640 RepID=UPI000B395410|nr:GNAT family N-acetyltransferase [Bacteroides sp. An51A]OUN79708.1 hypothetical protein B5G04_12955 [Bacteroides sp. An51A]